MKRLGFALLIGYCSTLLTSRILMGQKQTAFKQRAPSQFRELPQNLRSELERRGCMIPLDLPLSSNVVRGQFERPGEFDWAVLCSRRRVTRLLVFWKGSGSNVTELVKIPDEYASNWYIRKVGRAFIMRHYQAYGGPEPPLSTTKQSRAVMTTLPQCFIATEASGCISRGQIEIRRRLGYPRLTHSSSCLVFPLPVPTRSIMRILWMNAHGLRPW